MLSQSLNSKDGFYNRNVFLKELFWAGFLIFVLFFAFQSDAEKIYYENSREYGCRHTKESDSCANYVPLNDSSLQAFGFSAGYRADRLDLDDAYYVNMCLFDSGFSKFTCWAGFRPYMIGFTEDYEIPFSDYTKFDGAVTYISHITDGSSNSNLAVHGRKVKIESLNAPSSVVLGDQFMVSWDVTDADSVTFSFSSHVSCDKGPGVANQGSSTCTAISVGTAQVEISASGPGVSDGGTTVSSVKQIVIPKPSGNIWTNIQSCNELCDITIDYTTQNVKTCHIYKNGSPWRTNLQPNCPAGTKPDSNLTAGTYTYSIINGYDNQVLDSTTVQVNSIGGGGPQPAPSCSVGFSPQSITSGQSTTMSWNSSNDADGNIPYNCNGDLGSGVVTGSSGTRNFSPTNSQSCTLTVSNSSGSSTCSAGIIVDSAPPPPPASWTLTVTVSGPGSVSSSPAGISNCSDNTCTASFQNGTDVTLSASGENRTWGGDCSGLGGSSGPCVLTMTSDKSVTVTFSSGLLPPPSKPTVHKPVCSDVAYNNNPEFYITWSGTPNSNFGFYVDIDENPPDWNLFYNKNTGTDNWTDGTNFKFHDPDDGSAVGPALTLSPNIAYRTRVYNGTHSENSDPWVVNDCSLAGQIQCNNNGDNNCNINQGESVTISWSAPGADACNIHPLAPVAGWGNVSPTGSNTDSPADTRTYELECWNSINPDGVSLDFITVNVAGDVFDPPPTTITFSGFVYDDLNRNGVRNFREPGLGNRPIRLFSEDFSIPYNQTVTCDRLICGGVGYYEIEGPYSDTLVANLTHPPPPGWFESPPGSGNQRHNLNKNRTVNFGVYKLSPAPIVDLKCDDQQNCGTVQIGTSKVLSWSVTNGAPVDSCTASGAWSGSKSSSGSQSTGPINSDSTWTIQCTGVGGTGPIDSVSATVQTAPVTSNVSVAVPDYCVVGPSATINWEYSDSSGSPQYAYQVQIDDQPSFNSPSHDSGKVICQNCRSYYGGLNDLKFNTTYSARVRTWNGSDSPSAWQEATTCSGTGCQPNASWKTPSHAYPNPNPPYHFTRSPANPVVGQSVQFTDRTLFDPASNNKAWSWTFVPAGGGSGSSTAQNPVYTFNSENIYQVTESVRDNAMPPGQYCAGPTQAVNIQKPIPIWKEIAPR